MQELSKQEIETVSGGVIAFALLWLAEKSGANKRIENHERVTGTDYWGSKI